MPVPESHSPSSDRPAHPGSGLLSRVARTIIRIEGTRHGQLPRQDHHDRQVGSDPLRQGPVQVAAGLPPARRRPRPCAGTAYAPRDLGRARGRGAPGGGARSRDECIPRFPRAGYDRESPDPDPVHGGGRPPDPRACRGRRGPRRRGPVGRVLVLTVPAFAKSHGWTLLRHPAFRDPFMELVRKVEVLKANRPDAWQTHPAAKFLARLTALILDEIPRDPNAPAYGLGNTLGPTYRHWRRAKFLGRFQLFFRFDSASRVIIYAGVNDETTLRKEGAKSDPYAVFKRRLSEGDPPNSWEELLTHAQAAEGRCASGCPVRSDRRFLCNNLGDRSLGFGQ